MSKNNAKQVSITAGQALELMHQAQSGNAAFKVKHRITNYAIAKHLGIAARNVPSLFVSTRPETIDRITKALIEISGQTFDPLNFPSCGVLISFKRLVIELF